MTNEFLDAFALHNRISLHAVVTHGDQDPAEALAAAGIHDPVSFPITFGADAQPASGTPGIDAVLAFAAANTAADTPAAPPAVDPLSRACGTNAPSGDNAGIAMNPVTAGLRAPGDAQRPGDYVGLRDRIAQAKFSFPRPSSRPPGFPAASDVTAKRPGQLA